MRIRIAQVGAFAPTIALAACGEDLFPGDEPTVPINAAGLSVQYASTTGSSWSVHVLVTDGGTGVIPPGGFVLIQEAGASSHVTRATPSTNPPTPTTGRHPLLTALTSDC